MVYITTSTYICLIHSNLRVNLETKILTMEVLMSNWSDVQSMPENYVFPPDKRPGKLIFPDCKDIPTIDLEKAEGLDRAEIIQQIMKASQEFGFFQVHIVVVMFELKH